MRTIEKAVYQFDELSDEAKERARAWYRSCDDGYYLEDVVGDFREITKLIGLEVDDVCYMVSHSQGDYASFSGAWRYKKGCLAEVKNYAPRDLELHGITASWCDLQRKNFYRLAASPAHGRGCQTVSYTTVDGRYTDDSTLDASADICRDLADWLYRWLRDEVEYRNSDEAVDETIRANEYEFYENGEAA